MKKPVVIIIFNRPDTTQKVFNEIRTYQPEKFFVIADGPRSNNENDKVLCQQTRSVIKIDWECDVFKIYSDENLGCQQRIYTGLNEVFKYVEEAIILEDDCVPHKDFFYFCEEMLDYYKDNERVMSISGSNYLSEEIKENIQESYYFSKSPDSWGWATWKRSWEKIDITMSNWDQFKISKQFDNFCYDVFFKQFWTEEFDMAKERKVDSWFYPWMLTCWLHEGLIVVPKVNLISNIGFNENATHTKRFEPLRSNLRTESIMKPLKHPKRIIPNFEADYYMYERARQGEILKKKFYNEALKYRFIRNITLNPSGFFKIFKDKNVYIFGLGEWGLILSELFKENNITIQGFLQSMAPIRNSVNEIKVNSIDDANILDESIILVSIEGEHDKEIMELLRGKYKNQNVTVMSWKEFI